MSTAFAPIQLQQFSAEDFSTPEGVANFNQYMSIHTQRLNAIAGNVGRAQFPSGADMQGSSIHNVGGVGPDHSAISHAQAEAKYSAQAIAPQLEAGQPNSLKSVRRINDNAQREKYSTFLEGAMNTAPTTNSSTISGSGFSVMVSAGYHYYVSGNVVSYGARTDTLSVPATATIVSLTRTSSVVTAVLSAASPFMSGAVLSVAGVSDSSYDGSFAITSSTGSTITWRQVAPNGMSTGGTASGAGTYYYYLNSGSTQLSLEGPVDSDSQQNRLSINKDGSVLIAVAVVTSSGVDLTQSAAGSTPPVSTDGVRILTRL